MKKIYKKTWFLLFCIILITHPRFNRNQIFFKRPQADMAIHTAMVDYYRSGNIPWVLALVSINNYGPKHAYVLRQIFNKMIRKKTKVYWLRHDKDMALKRAAYGVTHVGRSE